MLMTGVGGGKMVQHGARWCKMVQDGSKDDKDDKDSKHDDFVFDAMLRVLA